MMATLLLRRVPLYRGARATFWKRHTDHARKDEFTAKVEWVNEDQTAMVTPNDPGNDEVLIDLRDWTWNLILD